MGSAVFGILFALVILVAAVVETLGNFAFFVKDYAGIIIVFGGTAAVAFITFSFRDVRSIGRLCLRALSRSVDDSPRLVREIVELARESGGDVRALRDALGKVRDPFLREGLALVVERMDPARIEMILRDRIRIDQETAEYSANMLRSLGKYPPALGIVGTVLGIIALLSKLDPKNKGNIGPAMAVGLVATFYGLVLTNFILIPMGENLMLKAKKEMRKKEIAMIGTLLMRGGEAPIFIQEALNSYLAPEERIDLFNVGRGEAGGKAA